MSTRKKPKAAKPKVVKAPGSGAPLPLPHEREESTGDSASTPDPVIEQAQRDLDAGLVDTDLRAQGGLDEQRRRELLRRNRR